jgi:protein phosphatase
MVHDAELEKILQEHSDPQKMCDKLIDLANDHGGEDNITALVVQVSK